MKNDLYLKGRLVKIFLLTIFFTFSFFVLSPEKALAVSPSSIPNMSLWLDASTGATTDGSTPATDGTTVTQWNDQSGNGNNATVTSGDTGPVYKTNIYNSKPVLRFSGEYIGTGNGLITSGFLDSSFNQNITVFIVSLQSIGGFEYSLSSGPLSIFRAGNGYRLDTNRGSLYKSGGAYSLMDLDVETVKYDGSNISFRYNKTASTTPATGDMGFSGNHLMIGSYNYSGSSWIHWNGDIAEILVYKRALTPTETANVEDYLINKYGIQVVTGPEIVFDGDSITAGFGGSSYPQFGEDYPSQALSLLGGGINLHNLGVPSETVATMLANAGNADAIYLDTASINISSLLAGINDIGNGDSATNVYNNIVAYVSGRKSLGFKTITTTITPYTTWAGGDAREIVRQAVNTSIRNNHSYSDAFIDLDADTRLHNPANFSDAVHYNDAGYAIIAEHMAAAIKQLITPLAISNVVATTTQTTASISWTTTASSSSYTNYGLNSSYTASTTESATTTRVTSHTDTITGLTDCTTYHYQAVSSDVNGVMATSTDGTFTTVCNDAVPPTVAITVPTNSSTVSGSSVTLSATSTDNIGVAGVQFKLDGTTNIGSEDTSSPYSVSWNSTGVVDGSHTISAVARDSAGNYATSTAVSIIVDNTAPIISSISSNPGETSANISWTTNELSDSQVFYGTTTSYSASTTLNSSLVTSHSASISGLVLGNTYHYAVVSKDASGNAATSSDQTLITVLAPSNSSDNAAQLADMHRGQIVAYSSGGIYPSNTGLVSPIFAATLCQTGAVFNVLTGARCSSTDTSVTPTVKTNKAPTLVTGQFTKDLSLGSIDQQVKLLQQYLNSHNFVLIQAGPGSPGNETTKFGVSTRNALVKFQKVHKILPSNGYLGPKTRNYINSNN